MASRIRNVTNLATSTGFLPNVERRNRASDEWKIGEWLVHPKRNEISRAEYAGLANGYVAIVFIDNANFHTGARATGGREHRRIACSERALVIAF